MSKMKKCLAAAVVCGGLISCWYVVTPKVVPPNQQVAARSMTKHRDAFADALNYQVMSVTRIANRHTRTVIFDTDAAPDDVLALILIGNDPGVDLQAITVAGTGEAHPRQGAVNMAGIATMLGKPQIPVAFGRSAPLTSAGKPFPDFLRARRDKLLEGTGVMPVADNAVTDNAVALIHEVVSTSDEKVTILATAPLTNIAEFIKQYPQLKGRIEKIVIMGGAVSVPGNIPALLPEAKNKVSEWNFYADPAAAHAVLASGIPITLVALDATRQVPMTRNFYESVNIEDQPDLRLAQQLLKKTQDSMGETAFYQHYYLWDMLAAMAMVNPASVETKLMSLTVDAATGQVKLAAKGEHGTPISVVTTIVHPEALLQSFVAMVKSNHIFAQRKFYQDASRIRARNFK